MMIPIQRNGFTLTPHGLNIRRSVTHRQWREIGRWLWQIHIADQMALGDWLNFGQAKWGEKYAMALDELCSQYGDPDERERIHGRLRNYAYVAGRVNKSLRHDKLTFTHYYHLASFEPDAQKLLIRQIIDQKLTTRQLADQAKLLRETQTQPTLDWLEDDDESDENDQPTETDEPLPQPFDNGVSVAVHEFIQKHYGEPLTYHDHAEPLRRLVFGLKMSSGALPPDGARVSVRLAR